MSTMNDGGFDVFFNQSCPVCGRTLHIRVQLLGRRVYCQHCGGGFLALDQSLQRRAPAARVDDRVDDLLERASLALERAGSDDWGDEALADERR